MWSRSATIPNEVSMSSHSNVIARTDRQIQRHDENISSTAYAGGKSEFWALKRSKITSNDLSAEFYRLCDATSTLQ